MPVEIRELVIKTTVTETPSPRHEPPVDLAQVKREIVAACVEEVYEKLNRKAER